MHEDANFYQRQLRLLRRMGRRAKRFGAKTLAPYGSAACSAPARRYSLWRWIDARLEGKFNVYACSDLQSEAPRFSAHDLPILLSYTTWKLKRWP